MKTFGMTHRGHIRERNEDRYIIKKMEDGSVLMAVADGLGGQIAGEYAAEIAVEKLATIQPNGNDIKKDLVNRVLEADLTILKKVEQNTDLAGMSATLCGSLLCNNIAYWVHVGDSRLYVLRNNQLKQITRDHNLAQYLLDNDEITAEEARRHPARHHLYQCVGCGSCQPDSGHIELKRGDVLVHTTDGLNEEVSTETITSLLSSSENMETRVKSLVQAALDGGGKDNITVAVAEI
jgi:protein phosphatase